MLGLKLATDPRWARLAKENLEALLTDHAWCEQKAVTNAISLIVSNPQHSELVKALMVIAKEELEHFEMVHEKILERGWVMGAGQKDDYVNELYKFVRKGAPRDVALTDRLLFAAMIEARSCERFRMLSQVVDDEDLRKFYHELMVSEAGHYKTFIGFARQYGVKEEVDKRWQEFLDYEAGLMANYSSKESMHG